jgi:hypothetical protein
MLVKLQLLPRFKPKSILLLMMGKSVFFINRQDATGRGG